MRIPHFWKIILLLAVLALPLAPINDALMTGTDQASAQGNGNSNRSDKAKEKAKNDKKEKKDKKTPPGKVEPVLPYVVDVTCEFDPAAAMTECLMEGTAPDGAKDIGFLQMLDGEICAPVIATDGEYAAPEPHTRLPGYKSKENKASLSLVMEGEVLVAGSATYWIKAGGSVFPITGPGVDCTPEEMTFTEQTPVATEAGKVEEPTAVPTEAPQPTQVPQPAGTLAVYVYVCTDVPADTTDFDWFGACQVDGSGETAAVTPAEGDAVEPVTATTDESGKATFEALPPGEYALDLGETTWCHAKSDNVTPDSTLILEDGGETSVYLFMCS